MAEKTGYPIIPMSINNTRNIFEAHRPFIRSAHVVLEYGEPIYPKDLPKEQKKFLGAHCQEIIQNTISKISHWYKNMMKKVSQISFYTGSREELLPGFTSKFPYISSCSDITKHPGHFCPWHWHPAMELFILNRDLLNTTHLAAESFWRRAVAV